MKELELLDKFFAQFSPQKRLELYELFDKEPALFLWLQENLFAKAEAYEKNNIAQFKKIIAKENKDIDAQFKKLNKILDTAEIKKIKGGLA